MAARSNGSLPGWLYAMVVVVLLVVCVTESVIFSVFNKYLFSGPLKASLFVTATHQVSCFLGATFVALMSPPSFYKPAKLNDRASFLKLMIIPFAFVMNIGMNNLSLQFTTLALNQLIRAFSPVAISITSFLIEGKVQSIPKLTTLIFLVAGVVMGVAASPDFDMLGFLICAGSVLGQSLGIVMTAFVMGGKTVKLHVFDVLLYASLPSLIVLLPWSYAMGEVEVLKEAIETNGTGVIVGLILAGGALAFTYNLFCTLFIKLTSSVYYGVTGGFRCAMAILISFFIFPQKITAIGIAGICVAMTAFIANSFFTLNEKLAARKRKHGSPLSAKNEHEEEDEEAQKPLLGDSVRSEDASKKVLIA